MKKLVIILFMLLFSNSVFAGWSTSERNSCKWWARKYHATARVFTGLPAVQTTGNCGYAYAEKIKNCAWQKASRGDNGVWAQGGVSNKFCSRGEVVTDFDQFFLPMVDDIEENIEESEITADATIFDPGSHTVVIPNISGKIKLVKNNGFYSDIRFSVWKPNDDNVNMVQDEKMDESEILSRLSIKLTDDGLIFKGDLVSEELKSKFTVVDNGREIYVVFNDVSLKIPVDSNIALEDIAVEIEGDGAPDTKSNMAKMSNSTDLAISNNDFKFKVYPNPTSDFINIEYSNNQSSGQTNISIYSLSGVKMKDVFAEISNRGKSQSIKVDISSYPKGVYLILVDNNGKKLSKQIIKN
ncbi:T9SS type A sorting domain-containing protein [Chryseobacterium formosus]|uniref:T9SS type A sorting domain-containing protein n=1 Tax=Chryseobacterium formosus TaxID=1537363 RepID=A0ABT3XW09_9FLAO|nr:T9SS type A sorting domain-containing protein [Chryseobacterium formosus]MCX8525871.1 T9SS type A sorting domain-containing protein [Chryseobacterium formosus]